MKRITQLLVVAAMMISALPASVQAQNTEEIKVYPSKDLQLRLGNSNQGGTGSAIEVRENTANNHEYGFCGIIEFDLTAVQAKIAQGYTLSDVSLRLTDCSNNRSANLAIRPFYSGWAEDKATTYDANAEYIAASIAGDLLTTVSLKRYGGKKAFELQNASTQVNPFPVSSYQGVSTDNTNLLAYLNDSLTAGKTAVSVLVGCDDYLGTQGSGFYTKDVLTGLSGTANCSQYEWSDTENKWVKIDGTDNTITRIAAAMQFFGLTEEQFEAECAPMLTIVLAEPTQQPDPDPDPEPEPVVGDYAITIDAIANGTVVASKANANEGDVVTLTVTPADNYVLSTLAVVAYIDGDSDTPGTGELARRNAPSLLGNIALTTVTEGSVYTFTMPAYNVKVSATFEAIPEAPARYLTVDKEWVTFCYPETFAVPSGLKAYTVASITAPEGTAEGTVTLTEQTVIAKNTPMLLYNENAATDKRFRIYAADDVTLSGLATEYVGLTEAAAMPTGTKNYVLKDGVFVLTTATTAAAYSCYLALPATSASRLNIVINDAEVTGVNSMYNEQCTMNNKVYDLQGRHVVNSQLKKGLYIVNGKKVMK